MRPNLQISRGKILFIYLLTLVLHEHHVLPNVILDLR